MNDFFFSDLLIILEKYKPQPPLSKQVEDIKYNTKPTEKVAKILNFCVPYDSYYTFFFLAFFFFSFGLCLIASSLLLFLLLIWF